MASILRVNTLTDASSNNSTAMSTINQGTAKAWVNFNGQGTIAARDSFNVASLTDNGDGDYTITFSNNMGNANYIINKTSHRLTKRRIEGIQKFKQIVTDISIEQFFAKKSTPQRLKHSLTHISSHKTGVFKSFFPVCMTNPSSCSSLFPIS